MCKFKRRFPSEIADFDNPSISSINRYSVDTESGRKKDSVFPILLCGIVGSSKGWKLPGRKRCGRPKHPVRFTVNDSIPLKAFDIASNPKDKQKGLAVKFHIIESLSRGANPAFMDRFYGSRSRADPAASLEIKSFEKQRIPLILAPGFAVMSMDTGRNLGESYEVCQVNRIEDNTYIRFVVPCGRTAPRNLHYI